jgi:hypothetical protein
MIRRHGKEEGIKKWDKYRNLQAESNSLEYKKEKYGWTEEEFKEFNKSRGITLSNMIKKYGKEEGKNVFNSYVEKQRTNGKTLEWFITKHGEQEGKIKYKEISIKKARGGIFPGVGYSKVSQDLFNIIDESLSKFYNTFYASKNLEKVVYIDEISKCYILDYYIEEIKVCIEFNGDYYHANPRKYPPDFEFPEFSKSKIITSKDIWEKDKLKKDLLLKEKGIKTIVIWEDDYTRNKDNKEYYKKIIKECIKK